MYNAAFFKPLYRNMLYQYVNRLVMKTKLIEIFCNIDYLSKMFFFLEIPRSEKGTQNDGFRPYKSLKNTNIQELIFWK